MSALPRAGGEVPLRHSRSWQWIGRSVLGLLGWRVVGEVPNRRKFLIAVAPHTSNWDFVVGAAAMFALDLKLSFLGKHTLFVGPFASLLRWMGGIPVDRSNSHGVVGDSVRAFESVERRILAIAPEGTRSPVPRFKSGFLHIARGAGVPVLLAALDYETRCVRLGPLVEPGPDVESERERIEAYFRGIRGRIRR
jgi:1-acyl-sn-glycerol-3-phosphate acyltransferase